MRRGFIQFPRSLIEDYPPHELGMMVKLFGMAAFRDGYERRIDGVAYLNDVGEFTASIRFLAAMLGIKKGQAERLMKKLVRIGVLKKTKTRPVCQELSNTACRTEYRTAPATYKVAVDAGLHEAEQSPSGQQTGHSLRHQPGQTRIRNQYIKKKGNNPPQPPNGDFWFGISDEAIELAHWFYEHSRDGIVVPEGWEHVFSNSFEHVLQDQDKSVEEIKAVCLWAIEDEWWGERFHSPLELLKEDRDGMTRFDFFYNRWICETGGLIYSECQSDSQIDAAHEEPSGSSENVDVNYAF
jgi:hypothetical protein